MTNLVELSDEREKALQTKITPSVLSMLGFDPCEPWEGWDKKYNVEKPPTEYLQYLEFNEDAIHKWFGYKTSSDGTKWYVVYHKFLLCYYFQRQIKIETIKDLVTVYENSTGSKFIN